MHHLSNVISANKASGLVMLLPLNFLVVCDKKYSIYLISTMYNI